MKNTRYSIRMLKVIHYGDYLTDLTAKTRKIVLINYLSLIKGYSHMIFQLLPSHKSTVDEAIDLSKSYRDVKYAESLKGPGIQPFIFMVKRNYGVLRAIADVKALKIGPVMVNRGVKIFPVVIPKGMKSRLIRLVKEYSPTEVRVAIIKPNYLRFTEPSFQSFSRFITFPSLTVCEFQILKEAYEAGYFEWPRKINLDYLAKKLGLAKPTVSEHIRKAEKKILRHYLENLAGIKIEDRRRP